MRMIIETENIKKNNISVNAYLIYEAMKKLKIKNIPAYRTVIKNIFGFSSRSITRYFNELRQANLIEQKHKFNSNVLVEQENNIKELFETVYARMNKGAKNGKRN